VRDVKHTEALAELGIVFFLFEMGLELSLDRLLSMRKDVFGLGMAQFLVTTAVNANMHSALSTRLITHLSILVDLLGGVLAAQGSRACISRRRGIACSLFLSLRASVVKGQGSLINAPRKSFVWNFAFSGKSHPAFLLNHTIGHFHAQQEFVLVLHTDVIVRVVDLQDLAVVPVLVMVPLLASGGTGLLRALTVAGVKAVVTLSTITVLGRLLLDKIFYIVAKSKSQVLSMLDAFMDAMERLKIVGSVPRCHFADRARHVLCDRRLRAVKYAWGISCRLWRTFVCMHNSQ
jgi:hypothetical protein